MSKSLKDQLLGAGVVKPAVKKERPPEPEKELPPPFEKPASGVISGGRIAAATVRHCVDCGAVLPSSGRTSTSEPRCAECQSP